jgi:hypothetical protein
MPTRYNSIRLALAAGVSLSASLAAAQQPRIANGAVTAQAAGIPFAASFRALVSSQSDVAWIGYSVPAVDGERTMCCFDSGTTFVNSSMSGGCCGLCRLENTSGTSVNSAPASDAPSVIKLEGSARMVVLFRAAERSIDRVRVFSEDCQLDAGGRAVRWLEGVRPADSVALLESLAVAGDSKDRVVDGALTAIALHADEAADVSLERLVTPPRPEAVRKKVTFWLGNSRGRRGFDTLRRVVREDPSVAVRKGAIFGLSQSRVSEAFDALIAIARTDSQPVLRGEALFWLAQKAGRKISGTIAERVDQDPDTDVKKKAVFALSQLPKEEGVPLLINVARTNKNIEVRKQAMFWLGQSKDPRAIDFFAEVLRK